MAEMFDKLGAAFARGDFYEVTRIDMNFHEYIIDRTEQVDLKSLWLPMMMRVRMNYQNVGTADACVAEHKAILSALKERDSAKAKQALRKNIR